MAGSEDYLLNLLPPKALVKMLASSCKKTRETGLQIFLSWLPQQHDISSTDLKNIWKGLFYSLWHADKLQFQSNLIDKISSLILALTPTLASLYSSLFFLTMHREWSGIDLLRLNKYYLFIRRFLHHLFLFLRNRLWDLEVCRVVMGDLEEGMFNYSGRIHGNGVNYHVVSVFLEELRPFLPLDVCVLEVLFGPFVSVVCRSEDKVLVEKAKVGVFDVLVRSGRGDVGGEVVLGSIVINMSFSERFYTLGSSPECSDCNRKVVLRLHEEFVKAERDLKGVGEGAMASVVGGLLEDEMEVEVEEDLISHSEEEQGLKKKRKKKRKGKGGKKRQAEDITHPETEPKTRKKAKKSEVESVHDMPEKGIKEESDVVGEEMDLQNIEFDEDFISNLGAEFERVAEENRIVTSTDGHVPEKGKRTKRAKKGSKTPAQVEVGGLGADHGGIRVLKKVTFAMKNNMVWKPHNPLPPQSVRIPPSLTPRGSALKKGVLPGPIASLNPGGGVRLGGIRSGKKKMKKMKKKSIVIISPSFKGMKMM